MGVELDGLGEGTTTVLGAGTTVTVAGAGVTTVGAGTTVTDVLGRRQFRGKRERGDTERSADEKTDLSHLVPP